MSKESITLNVEGMSCSHCENRVKNSVGDLDGVSSVTVSLDDKTVTIEYDDEVTGLDLVKETIEDQGYEVK